MTTDLLAVTAVMAQDAARLETGLRLLGACLGAADAPVGAAMLDVDGSAEIRRTGLPAKRALVTELQALVRAAVPSDRGVVVDSGTRDEILVLMPGGTPAGVTARAADLLDAIRAHPFRSEYWDGDLHVTASIGATLLDPGSPPNVAFATARAALALAKRDRDCVRFGEDVPVAVPVPVDAPGTDLELGEAVTRGLRRAEEKYGPMWFWLSRPDEVPADALRARAAGNGEHDIVFLALVDEIRAEAAHGSGKGAALRRRAAGAASPGRPVPLGSWSRNTLAALCTDLDADPSLVLDEALRLARLDRQAAAVSR